ncbi:semaphorin-4E-like [Saccoglossus kowalevskii]
MGGISVVCSYSVDDIRTVLTSEKYKNLPSTGKLWVAENYNSDPYPGECDDDSKNIPETTLNALKSHPLMWDSVPSIESQTTDSLPLLTSEGLGKQFTKILVAEVPDIAGTIHKVMYIGTDQGTVIKALYGDQAAYKYIITEFIVDEDSRDVLIMTMSDESLYIAFDDKVIQVPMQFCDRYTNCYSCVAARDPHCSWDTESSTCVTGGDDTGNLIQDVPGGNVALCSVQPNDKPLDKCVKKVPLDSAVIFDCKVMGAIFMKDGDEITVDGVKYIRLNGVGLLITNFKESDSGVYSCTVGGEIVAECWLISANQTLSTNVPEIHNLNLGPENITYPENTTVNLYCMFTGCFDTEYRWLNKDGIEVIETGSVMLESDCAANNESKIISWLEAIVGEETQTYTCEVDHVTKVFEIKPGAIENDANCRKDHMQWEIDYYDEIKKLNDWRQQANCTDENDDKIEINSCEMKDYCGIP